MTPDQRQVLESFPPAVEIELDDEGVPGSVMGRLSRRVHADPASEARRALEAHGHAFRRRAEDAFQHRLQESDKLGLTHVRMSQTYKGLRVIGGELVVHLASDAVIGISGRFVADLSVPTRPVITGADAANAAVAHIVNEGGYEVTVVETRDPVIFLDAGKVGRLAIPVKVRYASGGELEIDDVFVDARDRTVLGRHPRVFRAKHRNIYSADYTPWLPGRPMFEEGHTSADVAAMGAYEGTGTTYDFYKSVFGRDSFDNRGSPIVSSVHARTLEGSDLVAAWFPDLNQMAYGDGDGIKAGNLATSLDVTAHEVTHGVTQYSADLIYQNESGALNEASSDILGEATAFWAGRGDWKLAADIYTPGIAGDALRYMDDPARDNYSRDYYPEREGGDGCVPTGRNDNCHVHQNSGIANLFFYLLSQGGSHPRQRTNVVVPAIGIEKAQQIWYRALTVYMVPDSTFAGARTATARAAADLYGGACSPEWIAVHKGWDAVGVPGAWSCGCSVSISSTTQAFDATGGASTVAVTTAAGCEWSAASAAEFVTVTAGASGNGSGSVTFSVAPNSGTAPRTGTITIAGQVLTVTQTAAAACAVSISPVSQSFPATGGNGAIAVAGPAACAWAATTSDAFITVTTGAAGTGNATVSFGVAVNAGVAARTGAIAIGGQTFTVTQEAACASCAAQDFNGDGMPDIVWRNYATGSNVVTFMNNTEQLGRASLPSQYSAAFVISGIADFNNDRKPDLLIRDYFTGANTVWYFNGTTRIGSAALPSVSDTNWSIEDVADFNADGNADIVWRNYFTGANAVWYMNGSTRVGSASLPSIPDTSSAIDAIGDFNNDGRPDLLIRNYATGGNSVLFMAGVQQIGVEVLPAVTDTNWRIGGVADFNADGQQDVVWRNYVTGSNVLWQMNGGKVIGRAVLPAVVDTNWVIEVIVQ